MRAKDMMKQHDFVFDDTIQEEINYFRKKFISDTDVISFNLKNKTLEMFIESDSPFTPNTPLTITFEELQAINNQVEELGWNNENNRLISKDIK